MLNAIVGTAGLGPTIATLAAGIDLALANKESLVVGGDLVTALAEATEAEIIPVDSEHSALHQLIAEQPPGAVEKLVLTASGGPFRGRTDLTGVTPEEALDHPTWSMGGRITVDSATLLNKGLEVIEAHHLFGVPYPLIEVVVHPQSIVHALVQLSDGAHLAHLGLPDMRVPISYALHRPDRAGRRDSARPLRRSASSPSRLPTRRRSPACASRAKRGPPAATRPVCSMPPTRSPSPPSSRDGSRSRRSPR